MPGPSPRITVAAPSLGAGERANVLEALDRGWITSGPFVAQLEAGFAAHLRDPIGAVATSSGTAALHLALAAGQLPLGRAVVVPALTFVATAAAVTYCGLRPVFCDVDPETWCVDPDRFVALVEEHDAVAAIPVDLYGYPVDVCGIAKRLRGHVWLIEDAAEGIGARLNGTPAGAATALHAATFSFYGNKTLTTAEGGMLVSNDPSICATARLLRANGQGAERYVHEVLGFNYRMSDLHAAIGCAQLARLDHLIAARQRVRRAYAAGLPPSVWMQPDPSGAGSAHGAWAVAVILPAAAAPAVVAAALAVAGIETRPIFMPLDRLPIWEPLRTIRPHQRACPVASWIYSRGLVLPCHAELSDDDVAYVCDVLRKALP